MTNNEHKARSWRNTVVMLLCVALGTLAFTLLKLEGKSPSSLDPFEALLAPFAGVFLGGLVLVLALFLANVDIHPWGTMAVGVGLVLLGVGACPLVMLKSSTTPGAVREVTLAAGGSMRLLPYLALLVFVVSFAIIALATRRRHVAKSLGVLPLAFLLLGISSVVFVAFESAGRLGGLHETCSTGSGVVLSVLGFCTMSLGYFALGDKWLDSGKTRDGTPEERAEKSREDADSAGERLLETMKSKRQSDSSGAEQAGDLPIQDALDALSIDRLTGKEPPATLPPRTGGASRDAAPDGGRATDQ